MKVEFYHIDAFEVPNYEPIWRSLIQMGVDARIVGVPDPCNVATGGWFDFERFKSYCLDRSIPFTTNVDPTADIAITTQNVDILRDYACPRVRIMYGPIMYPAAWGFQTHAIKPFDAILTHGQYYVDLYSSLLRKDQLPVVGYPRYDDFFSGKLKRDDIRARWGISGSLKPTLVFLPTWGDNTAFDGFFPALVQLADQYEIILRPHHCTLRFEPQRMQKLNESGLKILDNAYDLSEVYAAADVVLSDVRSGGLFESCLCNVPTVGMVVDPSEVSGWIAQNKVDQLISVCSDPTLLAKALDIAMISKTQAYYRQIWVQQRVAFRDGTAGLQAAKALIELADKHKLSKVKPASLGVNTTNLLKPIYQTNLDKN